MDFFDDKIKMLKFNLNAVRVIIVLYTATIICTYKYLSIDLFKLAPYLSLGMAYIVTKKCIDKVKKENLK